MTEILSIKGRRIPTAAETRPSRLMSSLKTVPAAALPCLLAHRQVPMKLSNCATARNRVLAAKASARPLKALTGKLLMLFVGSMPRIKLRSIKP